MLFVVTFFDYEKLVAFDDCDIAQQIDDLVAEDGEPVVVQGLSNYPDGARFAD